MEGIRKTRRERSKEGGEMERAEAQKVVEKEGERENCENWSLSELYIFLNQCSTAAPPVHIHPLSDYSFGYPSYLLLAIALQNGGVTPQEADWNMLFKKGMIRKGAADVVLGRSRSAWWRRWRWVSPTRSAEFVRQRRWHLRLGDQPAKRWADKNKGWHRQYHGLRISETLCWVKEARHKETFLWPHSTKMKNTQN